MRRAMVASQLRTTAVNDVRVVTAMGAVPREAFVPAAQAPLAYIDASLPLGHGRALPTPMVLGRLLTEARVRPTDRVLVVGAATGYAAAVLAQLAAGVVALEEEPALMASAPLPATVTIAQGPLVAGWPNAAPYDVILFDGAVEHVPDAIVAQLAEDGRIAAGIVENGVTRLAIGRKAGSSFAMACFADAEVPVLPGFARPPGFRF
ncbi:protein-L-isoaspartate O-methyltransferase family protein [Sphingomonas nostoxanthinifaciens]|uniref:protein-L-isoaspartate O-methyltransferase family protein n=1 Tax=Sphingomonas nostoxanthinifaciens TaxID=2872652 RepID=UPI001CC1CE30|nr:protein-L-isoaspartate O-methyltransferase [Sphingomonas nostoxanthinifaciens]UAK26701.1 protein-L-isoaspartate O-methyltransferase [Sphingomonas nostoxanthinifaciens]